MRKMRLPDFARQINPAGVGTLMGSALAPLRRHWLGDLVFSKRGAIGVLELLLVVGCAHQLALLFWAVATPSALPMKSAPLSGVASLPFQVPKNLRVTTEDIFHGARSGQNSSEIDRTVPATALNLQLFGMRAPSGAAGGSAIIRRPDGTQDVFFVGQTIIDGVTLERIRADHVVIRRSGLLESLYLDQARTKAPAVQDSQDMAPTEAPPRRRITATASELFSAVQLLPGRTTAGTQGLIVRPGNDASLFVEAGFESGDILVAVNGQPTAQLAALPMLAQSLQDASRFTITIDRSGQPLTYQLLIDR
jgi:general secretion pathway protein C